MIFIAGQVRALWRPSERIAVTDAPCIVGMQKMLRECEKSRSHPYEQTLSLAQGVVFWSPPDEAIQCAASMVGSRQASQYCEDAGLPDLRAALRAKIHRENGLSKSDVMVMAFPSLCLLDAPHRLWLLTHTNTR
jgi:aspartate/methionine/tyrosine aminotransferase